MKEPRKRRLAPRNRRFRLFKQFVDEGHGLFMVVASVQTVHGAKMRSNLLLHEFEMTIILAFGMTAAVLIQFEDVNRQLTAIVPSFVTLLLEFGVSVKLTRAVIKVVEEFVQLRLSDSEGFGEENSSVFLKSLHELLVMVVAFRISDENSRLAMLGTILQELLVGSWLNVWLAVSDTFQGCIIQRAEVL